ncbi:MAG: helix-turn-helix transcriptional regulator [Pseudomonadota bacterium]
MQADEMRAIRKALGWTQQQLADQLGMSRKAIGEMETGKASIERRTGLAVNWLRHLHGPTA